MNTRQTLTYGLMGAPLAMAALPVYIHTPKLYGDEFGLGLTLTGAILLGARLIDTLQDPWLGRLSDYLQQRQNGWGWLMGIACICLSIFYLALFNPPTAGGLSLPIWFAVSMILVYTAHSALNITYLTWGARASEDTHERTRIVAFREGFGLLGVILASLLPMLLLENMTTEQAWLVFSFVFALILIPTTALLLRGVPMPPSLPSTPQPLFYPLRFLPFRRLATLFLLNGFAVAVAATLSLFYIADVLQLETYSGAFLALYFVCGAGSLPVWLRVSKRFGKTQAWIAGSIAAVIGFIWATQLGSGDWLAYAIVCMLSGAALGADLALPAAIAADIIPPKERGRAGGYFGIWSLINKGVLALAAGLMLPLLAFLGYQPGQSEGSTALALCYAGIPCSIKLLTVVYIYRWRHSLEIKHAE